MSYINKSQREMTAKEYYIKKYGRELYDNSQYDYSAIDLILFAEEYHHAKKSRREVSRKK